MNLHEAWPLAVAATDGNVHFSAPMPILSGSRPSARFHRARIRTFCTIAAFLISATGIQQPAQAQAPRPADSAPRVLLPPRAFPVVPFLDTVFVIRARLGSFTPQARAEAIASRIRKLAEDPFFSVDSLKQDSTDTSVDIVYGDVIVLSVSAADAALAGSDQRTLAAEYQAAIANSISLRLERTSWTQWTINVALSLFVLAVLVAIVLVVSRLFKRSAGWLRRQTGERITGFRIRDYELFSAKRSVDALLLVNSAVKWLVVAIAVYLSFPIVFGIFPWTRGLAHTLLGYVLAPLESSMLAVWNYIPSLITVIVIVWIFRGVLRALAFFRDEIKRGSLTIAGFYPDWAAPTYQIVRVLTLAFMIVVIFPYLPGSDSPVFQGVTVFLGLMFSFGSSGALSNLVAGLVLTYMRAFHIGDRVKIGEITGDIIERTLLVTRIRTTKNEIISIPNSTVMSSHTTNYSSGAAETESGLIVHTAVTIGYDVPWRDVHQLLIDAARSTALIEAAPLPFVLQTSLDDFYVSYQLNAFTRAPHQQAAIYSQLHQNIQDKFNAAEVEIMSPHYLAARDGHTSTIPADYLQHAPTVAAFRVRQVVEAAPGASAGGT